MSKKFTIANYIFLFNTNTINISNRYKNVD